MQILVLGDSSSFTGGYEPQNYPALMASWPQWPANTTIINPSAPGLTSADAARYYAIHLKSKGAPDVLVVYLGTNDSCSTVYPKGRATFAGRIGARLNRNWRATRNINVVLPFTFDPNFDPSMEKATNIEDFKFNIEQILSAAHGVPTQMIIPIANQNFSAGFGRGNFVFYRIFELPPTYFGQLENVPDCLIRAIGAELEGDAVCAVENYDSIIETNPGDLQCKEIVEIAINNKAIILGENGDLRAATRLLEQFLHTDGSRQEIALYNLSRIMRRLGRIDEADRLLARSAESDQSIRIRSAYRETLLKLSASYGHVEFIDLKDICHPNHFIDYCHLVPETHMDLASQIMNKTAWPETGNCQAKLETCPITPEYAFGKNYTLGEFLFAGNEEGDEKLRISKKRIEELAKAHPLFADGRDTKTRLPNKAELGLYQDAYVTRLLAPYLNIGVLTGAFDIFPSGHSPPPLEHRITLLPQASRDLIENDKAITLPGYGDRISALKVRVVSKLMEIAASDLPAGERYRSLIYWYFRESMRFGSHSRISMLYDRVELEQLKEAILGILVLARQIGIDEFEWCRRAAILTSRMIDHFNNVAQEWLFQYLSSQTILPDLTRKVGSEFVSEIKDIGGPELPPVN